MMGVVMKLFFRGRKRKTWITLCCLVGLVVFLQLNSTLYEYQEKSFSRGGVGSVFFKNVSNTWTSTITTKLNQSLLHLVTKSQHADVLLVKQSQNQFTKSPPLGATEFRLNFSVSDALQYGHFKQKKDYLTIAIPSIKRERGFTYLHDTLDSLIQNASPEEREMITIVIMFSDDDEEWNNERAFNVSQDYQEHIDSGLIQILVLPHQTYPDFSLLPRTYNDSVERLKWRSKQNVHYAFLFRYSHNISEYYLHLEDDVIVAKNYISDIKNFRRIRMDNWFFIRFSNMGFIGVFFRSSDLMTVSDFYLLFYAVQPCDYLINLIAKIKLQTKEIRFRPSLFQHQGIVSSLKYKRQPVVDRYFKGAKIVRRKKYYTINPPAEIDTTMVSYEDYKAEHAYKISDLYFWAVSPQKGQTYTIVLQERTNLTALIIVGGFPTRKKDFIVNGDVLISSSEHCTEWIKIGVLVKGGFNSRDSKDKAMMHNVLKNVTCVQIEVTKSQINWAILSEFALLQGKTIKI